MPIIIIITIAIARKKFENKTVYNAHTKIYKHLIL